MRDKLTDMNEGTQNVDKYWLQRISHEPNVSYKLLSLGYLSVGWSALATSDIENVIRADDERAFEEIMRKHGYGARRNRWALWNFCKFNQGDYVVGPLPNSEFSIYKIIGKPIPITKLPGFEDFTTDGGGKIVRDNRGLLYLPQTDETVDLGFVVKIEPIKEHISRYKYADNKLTARMKIRQTNADISDLAESIQNVIKADAPINLYNMVIEELAEKLLEAIMVQLTPDKFELLVKWYFEKLGASRAYRPAKNSSDKTDGADADVIAEFDSLQITVYVQAKMHNNVTDGWAVEQISKYKDQHEEDENTVIPWVISTANEFSEEANSMAQENKVHLITGTEFARLLIKAGITDIDKAFE